MARNAEAHIVLPLVADAIAVMASLRRPATASGGAPPFDLFVQAVEDSKTEKESPVSVLRQFAGAPIDFEPNRISVQCYTTALTARLSIERSAKIFDALIDDDYPRRGWIVGTAPNRFECDVFALMEGGLIGVDDLQRPECVFNFELAYRRLAN